MKPTIASTILTFVCTCLLMSCASGPDYAAVKNAAAMTPRNGKGLVLVYRESGIAGAGSKPFIWVNGTKMPGQLARGGYYSYDAAPGPTQVLFSWRDHARTKGEMLGQFVGGGVVGVILGGLGHEKISVDLNVAPNKTHYVLMNGRALSETSKENTEEALTNYK